MRAPAIAIASFVAARGGASSHEILERFLMDTTTLRRRRRELRRLGIAFVENGSGSYYAPSELVRAIEQLPGN
jgi:transposase-like protein